MRPWILAFAWLGLFTRADGAVNFALVRPTYVFAAPEGTAAEGTFEKAAAATIQRARNALSRPPGAIPRVKIEGTLPGHGTSKASLLALQDLPIARDLAFAWRLTGERAFLEHAETYLIAWASTYQMSYNPIDETGFDSLIIAHDLVEADLPRRTNRKLESFWNRMAAGYVERMEAGKVRSDTALTNWQSHRIKLAALSAYQVGNKKLIRRSQALFRKQIAANLRPDGSTLDFQQRDALHYVVYGLDPLLMAALAAQAHGDDWFSWTSEEGAGLRRSLEWFAEYARGAKTHIEFVNSTVEFDRKRAFAGVKAFENKPWNPVTSLQTFTFASLLDSRYSPLQEQLMRQGNTAPPDWLVLLSQSWAPRTGQ